MGYGLIRLKPDGSLDPSFQQRFSQVLVSEYPGGKMMVVEYQIGSNSTYILRRLLADGSVDGTFSPTTLVGGIPRVLVLGDGRLVIYGSFFTVDGSLQRQIAILQANGGRDPVFTSPIPNTGGTVRAAAISPDGLSIWVAGDILGLGSGRAAIARLGLNGAVDPSFSVPDAAQIGTANEVYPLASGQVLVASGGSLRRLTSAGSVDNGFSAAPVGTVGDYGPALYGGKILYLTDTGNPAQRQLRRMNLDGSDDATFSAVVTPVSTNYTVSIPAIGADGNLYFGPLTANRYAAHAMLTRVNSSGQIDLAYAPRSSTVATFSAYTRLANGKHLVAGAFSYVNNVATPNPYDLVRLNADGTTDSGFTAPAFSFGVQGLFPLADGKFIAVGLFPEVGAGVNIVRLKLDGTVDTQFQPITGAAYSSYYNRYNVAVDPSGYIYAETSGGVIKRYAPDGQLDSTFQASPASGYVVGLCATTDGELVVARQTTNSGIVRLTHSGAVRGNVSFTYTNVDVVGMCPLPNGDVFVASFQYAVHTIVLARTKPSGPPPYIYTRFAGYTVAASSLSDESHLDMAGAFFDLVRENTSDTSVGALIAPMGVRTNDYVYAGADGQAYVCGYHATGYALTKLQRTSLNPPSVSGPAPSFYDTGSSPPAAVIHQSVGSLFSLSYSNIQGIYPSYQWLHDGVPITGANTISVFFNGAKAADAGIYTLRATNPYGTLSTDPVQVIIDGLPPVTIAAQPASQEVLAGSPVTFSVTASSVASITYAWRRNGIVIAGETGSSLTLPGVSVADTNSVFDVIVQSNGVTVTSTPAVLTVRTPYERIFFGTISGGGNFAVRVAADGTATMIGVLPNGRGNFLVRFTVGSDGTFSTTLPVGSSIPNEASMSSARHTTAVGLSLSGSISGSSLVGTTASGDNFAASQQGAGGATAAIAGYYEAPVLYTANSAIAFIVGTDGSVIAITVNSPTSQAASGTVTAAGSFSLALGTGTTVRGTFGSPSGTVTGDLLTNGTITGAIGGVSATTTHTDRLVNISTRGLVGDGEQAMIAGFVITGTQPKAVLVRASGPTLGSYGVSGTLENPVLAIQSGDNMVASNDDWSNSDDAATLASIASRVGAFALSSGSKDAALTATLAPGVYSARVTRAPGTATGLALVEVYDAGINPSTESQKLVNISTRGEVRTGQNVMIAGFVVTGNSPKKVLIRGIGPTLASYGVGQVLSDPVLTLYKDGAVMAANNNWNDDPNAAAIASSAAQVGAFPLLPASKDAALLLTLAPGVYSAQVSGYNDTTGITLLEVYEVPSG